MTLRHGFIIVSHQTFSLLMKPFLDAIELSQVFVRTGTSGTTEPDKIQFPEVHQEVT